MEAADDQIDQIALVSARRSVDALAPANLPKLLDALTLQLYHLRRARSRSYIVIMCHVQALLSPSHLAFWEVSLEHKGYVQDVVEDTGFDDDLGGLSTENENGGLSTNNGII